MPKKPVSAIYFDGEKERYYVKRFLIENENKEEIFITEHANSKLEIVATDYRPVAELVFVKNKGIQKENMIVDLESFIALKGLKALGNQLTADKLKQINLLDPLPFEAPAEIIAEDLEVADEIDMSEGNLSLDDDGQITLSLD